MTCPIRIMCVRLKGNFALRHKCGLVLLRSRRNPLVRENRVRSKARAAKRMSNASEVIKHALQVAKGVISSDGHVSFVWPADDDAWSTSECSQLEDGFRLFRSYFRGPMEGKESSMRHRWAVSTTSLRILQLFGQHDIEDSIPEGSIPGEKPKARTPGSTFGFTANFANLVIESYLPERFYATSHPCCLLMPLSLATSPGPKP